MTRAFTLVEALLVVVIIVVIITITTAVYRRAVRQAQVVSAVSSMNQKLNKAIADGKMTRKSYEENKGRINRILLRELSRD